LGWDGGGGAKEAAAARRGWAGGGGGGAKEVASARRVGARVRICFRLIPYREIIGDCTSPIGPVVAYIYRRHTDYKLWRTRKLPRKPYKYVYLNSYHRFCVTSRSPIRKTLTT
jgi:hypothetical protein